MKKNAALILILISAAPAFGSDFQDPQTNPQAATSKEKPALFASVLPYEENQERTSLSSLGFDDQRLSLSAGLEAYEFDYQEQLPAPFKSIEKGVLPAVDLGFKIDHGRHLWFLNTTARLTIANTKLDGSNQQSGAPINADTHGMILDTEADFGLTLFSFTESSRLRGYSGLGYHYWQRGDGSVNQDGIVDYREQYSWAVLPVGIRFENELNDFFSLNLDVSARASVLGHIKVYMTDLGYHVNNPEMALGSKLGYRVQLPLTFRMSQKTTFSFSPWFEYFSIGHSDPTQVYNTDGTPTKDSKGASLGILEPDSRTYEYGSSFAVALSL